MTDDAPLLPELLALVHAHVIVSASTGPRARCLRVCKAWLARDRDLCWFKHHPDLALVTGMHRRSAAMSPGDYTLYLCTELAALPFDVPAPVSISAGGVMQWDRGQCLRLDERGYSAWGTSWRTIYGLCDYLAGVAVLLDWWPGELLWLARESYTKRMRTDALIGVIKLVVLSCYSIKGVAYDFYMQAEDLDERLDAGTGIPRCAAVNVEHYDHILDVGTGELRTGRHSRRALRDEE